MHGLPAEAPAGAPGEAEDDTWHRPALGLAEFEHFMKEEFFHLAPGERHQHVGHRLFSASTKYVSAFLT